jgi:NtrC-family two-component system sensor histidine kinase KinB
LQLLNLTASEIVGVRVEEVSKHNDLFRFLLAENGNVPFKIVVDNRENYFVKETIEISQDGSGNKVIILKNITSFKELDVAKNNFIATISHELKTPLASSDLSLKLLSDERISALSGDQLELVQNLKNDNQRMLRILSELLNMSQVEAGKILMDIRVVEPDMIAENAIETVGAAAKDKAVTIVRQYRATGKVLADAEKTGWVMNNFLINAIKHSITGGTVTVTTNDTRRGVEFIVSDKGSGIAGEYLPRVFERFFRVPGSQPGGTGLGLAISKEFIEAEEGTIWVRSKAGSGSEFGFSLPGTKP